MTTLREAAQQALEALLTYEQYIQPLTNYFGGPRVPEEGSASAKVDAAINALRAALAEPVQEPVAWIEGPFGELRRNPLWRLDPTPPQTVAWSIPLYLAQPQRKPLTEEQIDELIKMNFGYITAWQGPFVRAIERAHGIGGQK